MEISFSTHTCESIYLSSILLKHECLSKLLMKLKLNICIVQFFCNLKCKQFFLFKLLKNKTLL